MNLSSHHGPIILFAVSGMVLSVERKAMNQLPLEWPCVLPAELSNLKQLQVLDLSHNRLMGRVSPVLSGLKMIQSLNVSSNSLNGDLLELGGFPNLSPLKELHVDVNSISGHLPCSLYSFTYLQQLSLSENYFSGHLSKELNLAPSRTALDWNTRMKIARGAAKGLEYLHESASPPVIYRGFKASNILLDKDFNEKLFDFGLARLGPPG
ncbi:hypothetical protein Q3G72_012440 [Acer saccharum]|nr:hypothetical protein Q3G72_012440 [Acer saccharum]